MLAEALKHLKCPSCGNGVQFTIDAEGYSVCPACNYHLPREIGHFKLVELLGTGGMGAVFRGVDTSLQREVAIKIMREEMTKSEKFVADFLREARATAALNHPNIAKIYTCGEEGGRYFIVMELLQNGSLDDRINSGERVDEIEVLDIGIQVASGLREAQKHVLIHRDIKPGNVLFDEERGAKLVDFGLARLEEKSEEHLREEGIWGTPYYIAPEKVARNQEDFRSDIYSLGGTLFHALAGRAPFEAETSNEVVEKHLQAASVSLQAFAPNVAPQTAYVIGRMMRREPAERQQSYDQLLDELYAAKEIAMKRRALQNAGIKKDDEREEEPFPWGGMISIVLVVVGCVIALIFLWQNRDRYLGGTEVVHKGGAPAESSTFGGVAPKGPQPGPGLPERSKEPLKTPPVHPPPSLPGDQPQVMWQKPWQTAQETLAAGKPSLAVAQLKAIDMQLPPEFFLQPWVSLQLGVASLYSADVKQANQHFENVIKKSKPGSPTGAIPEDLLPLMYAKAFLGQIGFDDLQKQLLQQNSDWTITLLHFYSGLHAEQSKDFEKACREWKLYDGAKAATGKQAWVTTFKPLVQRFIQEYPGFSAAYGNAEKAMGRNDPETARSHLEKIGELDNRLLRELVRDLSARVDKALVAKTQREATRIKAEQDRKQRYSEQILDDAKKAEEALIQKYDFQEVLAIYTKAKKNVETEDVGKQIDTRLRRAEKMAEFKIAILNDIQTTPYTLGKLKTRSNSRLIGQLVRADDRELEFRLEGGFIKARWTDLTPESLCMLGEFYMQKAMAEKDKVGTARRAYSLAALAHAFRFQQPLRSYLNVMEQADPAMKSDADRMFANLK